MSDNVPTSTNPLRRVFAPVRALFVSDASAGILLILVAAAAMIAANSPMADEYRELFYGKLPWTPIEKLKDLHYWINDGLMAIFFFVVGLEVKREIISGSLADPAARRLPMLAAAAGMGVPAIVYLLVTGGGEYFNGWAIPAATDIAFAMGVLGLLGNRVPASLRLFLLTVAIVDDIGAVLVIAVFYTQGLYTEWLVASVGVVALMIALNRMRVDYFWPYILLSIVLWYCVLNSGVHATIAGVVAALTIPLKRRDGNSMLERLEHAIAPWSAYLVVPVFGFANAGVSLEGMGPEALLAPLPIAIAAGLVVGKQVGIFTIVWLADKSGFAPRPDNASWPEIWGISILCGIGFTMSIFIGGLAFPGAPLLVEEAKIGILTGSAVSAILGYIVLRMTTTHPAEECDDQGPIPQDTHPNDPLR
ncbi:Na+/H+ antiporter NhaA [Erythrobacter sp. KY5]|uniref:Na+/H+ antiporter NhaA n=1 Tax=Erythrobacter sp. KY5 TaxID=2011159 RepID=UPI0015745CF3|nr:Na+/H+ antiporter NhaA [Erythrobacter sp. KY5]